ncbi:hypothetical protein OH76DRAFT_1487852 [Lentinus brumalis]|uniref:Uncharacterized protein n=1 Tax=Lentinus brumalis TaxID=2498619 RepID=A0A371CT48_9APHY|nr:hypothetical protein OH76DRAFT_1487852 [Polyporus brumalis]
MAGTIYQGLRSAELQAMAEKTMQEYQDQMMELRRRIADAGSVYNSGAAINEKPRLEGFLQIFCYVTPSYVDFMAPIRLTHVCRAWRTLIHRSPVFWMDKLDPVPDSEVKASFTSLPIVLAAFEKSQPALSLRFSLHWAFLPTLATIPSHVSPISTLWLRLVCSRSNDTLCGLFL